MQPHWQNRHRLKSAERLVEVGRIDIIRSAKTPTLAFGLMLVAEGRIGVPSGAITKLALPHALLEADTSHLISPEANDF